MGSSTAVKQDRLWQRHAQYQLPAAGTQRLRLGDLFPGQRHDMGGDVPDHEGRYADEGSAQRRIGYNGLICRGIPGGVERSRKGPGGCIHHGCGGKIELAVIVLQRGHLADRRGKLGGGADTGGIY